MANRLLQSVPIWQKHWLKKSTKQRVARCHHCAVWQISKSSDGYTKQFTFGIELDWIKFKPPSLVDREGVITIYKCAVGSSIDPRSRRFCQNMPEMCNIFFIYVASYFSRLNDKFLELYWWRIIQLCTFPSTSECLAKRVHSDSKIDNLDDPNTRGSVIFQNCLHVSLQFAYLHKLPRLFCLLGHG